MSPCSFPCGIQRVGDNDYVNKFDYIVIPCVHDSSGTFSRYTATLTHTPYLNTANTVCSLIVGGIFPYCVRHPT